MNEVIAMGTGDPHSSAIKIMGMQRILHESDDPKDGYREGAVYKCDWLVAPFCVDLSVDLCNRFMCKRENHGVNADKGS